MLTSKVLAHGPRPVPIAELDPGLRREGKNNEEDLNSLTMARVDPLLPEALGFDPEERRTYIVTGGGDLKLLYGRNASAIRLL